MKEIQAQAVKLDFDLNVSQDNADPLKSQRKFLESRLYDAYQERKSALRKQFFMDNVTPVVWCSLSLARLTNTSQSSYE